MASHASSRAETRGSVLLWLGLLAGPLAWTVQIVTAPDVTEVLCYAGAGAGQGQVYGVPIGTAIVAMNVVLTAIALSGLLAAVHCWRGLRASDATTGGRARWMARAGILVSVLFLLAIVFGYFPVLFLSGCATSL